MLNRLVSPLSIPVLVLLLLIPGPGPVYSNDDEVLDLVQPAITTSALGRFSVGLDAIELTSACKTRDFNLNCADSRATYLGVEIPENEPILGTSLRNPDGSKFTRQSCGADSIQQGHVPYAQAPPAVQQSFTPAAGEQYALHQITIFGGDSIDALVKMAVFCED